MLTFDYTALLTVDYSAKLFAVARFLLLMSHQMSPADAFHICSLIVTDRSPPREHFFSAINTLRAQYLRGGGGTSVCISEPRRNFACLLPKLVG